MFKKRMVSITAVFNILMIFAFVSSNIYIWNFLDAQINAQGGRQENGIYVIPFIQMNGLQITVGHDAWTTDGVAVPTALPLSVPNYPFMIFCTAFAGNLIILALLLRGKYLQ